MYLCTDLNPHATRCTHQTGLANSVPLNPILTNLTSSLLPRLTRQVDVLVFNPPYVETEEEELYDAQEDGTIEKAWAGGESGMKITNKVLEQVEVRFLLAHSRAQSARLILHTACLVAAVRKRALLPCRDSSEQTFGNSATDERTWSRGRGELSVALAVASLTDSKFISTQITLKRRAGREHLHILRFRRSTHPKLST